MKRPTKVTYWGFQTKSASTYGFTARKTRKQARSERKLLKEIHVQVGPMFRITTQFPNWNPK